MKRLVKSYPVPLWIVALLLVACTSLASGWSASYERRMEQAELYQQRIASQAEMIAGLMAANAIILGGWQHEAAKAGTFEAQRNQCHASILRRE
ncbi:hypothetical protein [Vreelandella populi]|uniref:hypothetical protein n=1 Tax=Vreelandella populi TaxID=2498858 RepID=UPI000F8E4075|nr:hypothetical protein [Halomonas populi]RUR38533.1 hypothetical protein ELY25_09220 [Halomonas populi]